MRLRVPHGRHPLCRHVLSLFSILNDPGPRGLRRAQTTSSSPESRLRRSSSGCYAPFRGVLGLAGSVHQVAFMRPELGDMGRYSRRRTPCALIRPKRRPSKPPRVRVEPTRRWSVPGINHRGRCRPGRGYRLWGRLACGPARLRCRRHVWRLHRRGHGCPGRDRASHRTSPVSHPETMDGLSYTAEWRSRRADARSHGLT